MPARAICRALRAGRSASVAVFLGLEAASDSPEDSLAVEEEAQVVAAGVAVGVEEGLHVDGEDGEGARALLCAPPGVEISVELPANQAGRAEGFEGVPGDPLVWNANGRYPARRFLVIGLGPEREPAGDALRSGCARAARVATKFAARSLAITWARCSKRAARWGPKG